MKEKRYKTPKNDGVYREEPCPYCGGKVLLIPPETEWCENETCSYSTMQLIGNGIMDKYLEAKNSQLFQNPSSSY